MCTQINNTCLAFMLQSKAVTCPCETPFGKTRSSFGGNVPNCTESPCLATFFFISMICFVRIQEYLQTDQF